MKKTVMILGLVLCVHFANAQSQRPQRGERPSPEKMIERATKELSLTAEQVEEWKAIHKKYSEEMKDRSKAEETRKKMGAELEKTLTEEQLEKFKKMRPKRRPNKDGR
ncbi:hypothetical protein [Ekhidna sp.]